MTMQIILFWYAGAYIITGLQADTRCSEEFNDTTSNRDEGRVWGSTTTVSQKEIWRSLAP